MLNYITRYFTLNRRERNAILVLITLLFGLVLTKYFVVYHYRNTAQTAVLVELDSVAAHLAAQEMVETPSNYYNNEQGSKKYYGANFKKDSLFYFDPNTISLEQAMQLGFSQKCAQMLINYRSKGGKFYKPADLEKLYCMNETLFKQLKPYVIIAGSKKESTYANYEEKKEKKSENFTLEINSADSNEWVKLRGIGPGYTRRILKYKSLLGGYTSIEQLREVYGFTDSLYNSIKDHLTVDPKAIQKLKVNEVDFKTMVHHPYIKYEGTKCIFALKRNKKIKEEDLVNSSCFPREHLPKLLPYLDFE